MKKTLFSLAALPVLLCAATALQAAAPTPELKVTGKIASPTCTVSSPDNGVYDFGKIPAAKFGYGWEGLDYLEKSWVISCDSKTYLTFTTTDNRADSMAPITQGMVDDSYGLGFINGTGKIGYFRATVPTGSSTVDGVAVKPCQGNIGSSCAVVPGILNIRKNTVMSWATADNVLKAGQVFQANIRVSPVLGHSGITNGPITENTKLDGSMTLNFAYGI